ncbi:ATP-binding protein, partial [Bacillus sp. AF62]
LWVITQQVSGQLDRELTDMLTEAGGNYFVCRQGHNSAKTLEGIMQKQFRTEYLQNLPNLIVAIQTQDYIRGEAKNVWCTIRVPPLDRYLPNGKAANYKNEKEIHASNEWTRAKIHSLEQQNGKAGLEIDKEIDEFLYGKGKYLQAEKVDLTKEEPVVTSGLDELEEKISSQAEVKEPVSETQLVEPTHQAQIIPFRKQATTTIEVKKEDKPVKEPVITIEKEQTVSIETENVEIKEDTSQEEVSIFDMWEKE